MGSAHPRSEVSPVSQRCVYTKSPGTYFHLALDQNPNIQWDKLENLGDDVLGPRLRGREGHSAVVYRDRYIYFFGGYAMVKDDIEENEESWMNDLLLLDTHSVNTKNIAWESIMRPNGAPSPRKATLQWLLIIKC